MSDAFAVRHLRRVGPSIAMQVAMVTILAWGREATGTEVAERSQKMLEEAATTDPSQKAVFVALDRQEDVVGVARIMSGGDSPSTWVLYGLAVHPQHRRQGIGRALAQAAVVYAKERGCRSVRSDAHTYNVLSLRFHRGIGFQDQGNMVDADGDEIVRFVLNLRP
jgi:ribosomal protein S18 acetylase RimI-like enzyme